MLDDLRTNSWRVGSVVYFDQPLGAACYTWISYHYILSNNGSHFILSTRNNLLLTRQSIHQELKNIYLQSFLLSVSTGYHFFIFALYGMFIDFDWGQQSLNGWSIHPPIQDFFFTKRKLKLSKIRERERRTNKCSSESEKK